MTLSIRSETREALTPPERVVLAPQCEKPDRGPAAPLVCGAYRAPTMGFVYGPLGALSQIRSHAEVFKDVIRDAGAPVIAHNCGGVSFDAVLEHINPIAISHACSAHGFSQAQVLEDRRAQIETFGVAEGGLILSSGGEFPPAAIFRPPAQRCRRPGFTGDIEA